MGSLPSFANADATRKHSEHVLNALADQLPELLGGSADLTESNLTKWKGSSDFQSPSSGIGSYSGRYFRFGVREHAMFAVCNGIAAYGCGLIPFASTFLNFITYGWGAVRLSALSHLQVIYVMTHDSIGLGEDGPTHQPVETLAALRALPNCLTIRPADGNEVSGAYKIALEHGNGPTVICLTRQKVPPLALSSIDAVRLGAYVVRECAGVPSVVLVGTGSEVSVCMEAAGSNKLEHLPVQVVSMPSWELFERQADDYKQVVFPKNVPVVSVEAASTLGWERYADRCVGLSTFGRSGPYDQVYKALGISAEKVSEVVEKTAADAKSGRLRTRH
jgi:transketolase